MPFSNQTLSNEISSNVFLGIVEDNIDPKRLGRCRVRVQSLFDQIDIKDIPWSVPIKSSDGEAFNLPSVGKLVNVIFENSDLYSPVYYYSEIYNYNLQKKLNGLSSEEYNAFSAIYFDHRTQIYTGKNELTLDYFLNKITISADNINLELKDNSRQITLGSKSASQQAMLGNHFLDYLDQLVTILQNPLSLTGNFGAPILRPELDTHLAKYWTLRPTFISNNVSIVDNNKVNKLNRDETSKTISHDKDLKINGASILNQVKQSAAPNQLNPLQNKNVITPSSIQNIKDVAIADKKQQLNDQKYQGFGERNFIIQEDTTNDIKIIEGDKNSKDAELNDYSSDITAGTDDMTVPIAQIENTNQDISETDYSEDNSEYDDENYGAYKPNSQIVGNSISTINKKTADDIITINSSVDSKKYDDIKKFVLNKGYVWYDKMMWSNWIWYRSSYIATNKFTDSLFICYINTNGDKVVYSLPCTTKPGLKMSLLRDLKDQPVADNKVGTACIYPGQYIQSWEWKNTYNEFSSYPYFRQIKGLNYLRDSNRNNMIEFKAIPDAKNKIYGTHWHKMSNSGFGSGNVNNFSQGCMGTPESNFAKLIPIVNEFVKYQGKLFTGTILDDQDFKLIV